MPGFTKIVTQEDINLYARASQDFNPIHIDEDFARKAQLGGTIAHGMLILAYVSQMMGAAFGRSWLEEGKVSARFKTPARPGDTIAVSGRVSRVEEKDKQTLIQCDVLCSNQNGEPVITGETRLAVKNVGFSPVK